MADWLRVVELTEQRASVRWARGGQGSDVVGHVLDGPDPLVVAPWDRPAVRIAASELVVGKVIGDKTIRPSSSPTDLARLAADGWRGDERVRLGGWLVQAGGGWTNRANHCLIHGDPGIAVDAAIREATQWYAQRGLPGLFHLCGGADGVTETDRLLAHWPRQAATEFMVADLVESSVDPDGRGRLVVTEEPTDAWLSLFRGGSCASSALARRILTNCSAHYLTLTDADEPVAIARLARTLDWAGIAAVEVHPAHRRRGWGAQIMARAVGLATQTGARFGYLQVGQDNAAALALYRRLGWAAHHRAWYRRQP